MYGGGAEAIEFHCNAAFNIGSTNKGSEQLSCDLAELRAKQNHHCCHGADTKQMILVPAQGKSLFGLVLR